MKRLLTLIVAIGFVFTLTGCQLFQKKQEPELLETDSTVLSPVEPDTSADEAAMPADTYAAEPAPIPTPAARIHVVQPKETIYDLARRYYGDIHQWRRIWQANQDQVPDPNKIKIGQKLVIPE